MPEWITPKLCSFASMVDDATLEQAKQIAELPFVHPHVALMPDAHAGKGSSVGTVIPTRRAVIPAAVGVDIGCGMVAVKTKFHWRDMHTAKAGAPDLSNLRGRVEAAIPMSAGNYNDSLHQFTFTADRISYLEWLAATTHVDLLHSPKWREQLGTLGGGNHFIELCVDDSDRVWLFLHSGSRGVGNKIAQKHIKVAQQMTGHRVESNRDLAWLPEGSAEFDTYIRELMWAQAFARENRDEMMDRFIVAFAEWLGVGVYGLEMTRINTHHNYTQKEWHGGELVWLTRKGAISALSGEWGLIPGSMGTASYVVRGNGNPDGLCSAPHGAGRQFSRTQAKKQFTEDDLREAMKGIEYRHGAEWVDEIPAAYKPISVVMKDAAPLVTVVNEFHQVLNCKGT